MTRFDPDAILSILDRCCDAFSFPMLDNGYVSLASTRLSLFRSTEDWAMVIEVFGFSPRARLPDTNIYTFASRLHDRDPAERYVSADAHRNYLANNPHNESRFIYPIAEGPWQDPDNEEMVAEGAPEVMLRGQARPLPDTGDYARHGIELEQPPRVQVWELCRYLAAVAPNDVLTTPDERRISMMPEMKQVLQLDEWHHPNVADSDDRPSRSQTFRQLAHVLATGEPARYQPALPPNTHWRHWPDGGTL